MKNLLAIDTIKFFVDFLPTFIGIVIALAVIAFVIIAVIEIKNRRKTSDPDETETVDEAAQNEQESEEAPVACAEEQQSTEENAEEAAENEEDEDEEITFEAEDVEPEEKADGENNDGAKEQKEGAPKRKVTYRILYDRESKTWEIRKDNAKRVIRRVKTKKEALEIAQELSKNQDVNLVVHKKDGKFQKKENWSRNISSGDSESK